MIVSAKHLKEATVRALEHVLHHGNLCSDIKKPATDFSARVLTNFR